MIKDNVPIIVTAIIAISGNIFQFLYFFLGRRHQINDTRIASIGHYYFDLMRLLTILNNIIFGRENISNELFDAAQKIAENGINTSYDEIFDIYQKIEDISSSGKYLFMNKEIHNLLLKLSRHIASINYSKNNRLTEEQLGILKQSYPLPDIAKIMTLIDKASK